jgi:hypothetical protein
MAHRLELTAEVSKALEKSTDGLVGIVRIEVIASEISLLDPASEHVEGSLVHRQDGFLRAASGHDVLGGRAGSWS